MVERVQCFVKMNQSTMKSSSQLINRNMTNIVNRLINKEQIHQSRATSEKWLQHCHTVSEEAKLTIAQLLAFAISGYIQR